MWEEREDEDHREEPEEEAAEGEEGDDRVPCPHCGKEIYEEAERCPACGSYVSEEDAPRRRSRAADVVIAILVIVFLAALIIPLAMYAGLF